MLPTYQVIDAEGNIYVADILDLGVHFGYELPKDRFRQPYMARKVKVVFQTKDVPALGYQTYGLVPAREQEDKLAGDAEVKVELEANRMENEYLRVSVEQNGTITLLDKRSGTEYHGLNVYENTGDIGNEYVYRQPEGEQALSTKQLKAELRLVEHSLYRAVMESVLRWNIRLGQMSCLSGRNVTWFRSRSVRLSVFRIPFLLRSQPLIHWKQAVIWSR